MCSIRLVWGVMLTDGLAKATLYETVKMLHR